MRAAPFHVFNETIDRDRRADLTRVENDAAAESQHVIPPKHPEEEAEDLWGQCAAASLSPAATILSCTNDARHRPHRHTRRLHISPALRVPPPLKFVSESFSPKLGREQRQILEVKLAPVRESSCAQGEVGVNGSEYRSRVQRCEWRRMRRRCRRQPN